MNRPLRWLDLGSSTAISNPWVDSVIIETSEPRISDLDFLGTGNSITRALADVDQAARQRKIDLSFDPMPVDGQQGEAAKSFFPPKTFTRFKVVAHSRGKGTFLHDD